MKILFTTTFWVLIVHIGFAQTTIVLQPNAELGKDAYYRDIYPDLNQGNHIGFTALAWTKSGTPVVARSVIDFDFSEIPLGATINSAYLSFYNNPDSQNNNGQHSTLSGSNASILRRITSSWRELAITWNNQPSTTIENEIFLPPSTNPHQDYTDIDVTPLIQDIIDFPDSSFGLMFSLVTEEHYRCVLLSSSDHPDPTKHPKLVITYTIATDIQEAEKAKNTLNVYPNPSSNDFVVKFENPTNAFHLLKMYKNNGQLVLTKEIRTGNIQIETANLSSGMYYLQLENDGNILGKERIIIE